MDALLISSLVKKSIKSSAKKPRRSAKKEHIETADFLTPSTYPLQGVSPSINSQVNPLPINFNNNDYSMNQLDRSSNPSQVDNSISIPDNSIYAVDNSMPDNSFLTADNSDNSDNSNNLSNSLNTDVLSYDRYIDNSKVDNSVDLSTNSDSSINNITINNYKLSEKRSVKMNINGQLKKDEEQYENMTQDNLEKKAEMYSNITFFIMLLINCYAAYLSWECNSANNYPIGLKLIFAFFAFMFGTVYILYYILFRFDDCNKFEPFVPDRTYFERD